MAHNKKNERKTIVADPTPKRRKLLQESSMENTISDCILHNILSRLSAKPLMRSRCVSKHWNSLITDPYFINYRSRRTILITSRLKYLYAFDDKLSNLLDLTYPFKNQTHRCDVIGTLNGIAVLVLESTKLKSPLTFILYNPLTRAAKKLPVPPDNPCCGMYGVCWAYGFANGNIITAKYRCGCPSNNGSYCNVFSLKKGSWTRPETAFARAFFLCNVGMLLNGSLHWISSFLECRFNIVALDVTSMVATSMDAPPLSRDYYHLDSSVLGTLHGCLCMFSKWRNGLDVWVMMKKNKEEQGGAWSKQYSFPLLFYRCGVGKQQQQYLLDVCSLEDGRIIVGDVVSNQIFIWHPSKRSYDTFKPTNKICLFQNCFEYVESLVSPSDIYHV